MCEQIVNDIMSAIDEAKKMTPTRELSLVITKLEEALLWYRQHNRVQMEQRK